MKNKEQAVNRHRKKKKTPGRSEPKRTKKLNVKQKMKMTQIADSGKMITWQLQKQYALSVQSLVAIIIV